METKDETSMVNQLTQIFEGRFVKLSNQLLFELQLALTEKIKPDLILDELSKLRIREFSFEQMKRNFSEFGECSSISMAPDIPGMDGRLLFLSFANDIPKRLIILIVKTMYNCSK
jgi:hypothetical protein